MTKPLLSQLTRETRQDWNTTTRTQKTGRTERGFERAEQWARWRLAERGIEVPEGAVATTDWRTNTLQFMKQVYTPGWTETLRGPRGGFKGYEWHPATSEDTVACPPVHLPPHCRPVKFADRWHEAHQQGLSLEHCARMGRGEKDASPSKWAGEAA